MERVSQLITEKAITTAKRAGLHRSNSKRKVIATLFPYAILQERDGQPRMLDALSDATSVQVPSIDWNQVINPLRTVFREATPRGIVLASSCIQWDSKLLEATEDLLQQWVAATSVVQSTEEVARCVVGTLLRIAAVDEKLPHITVGAWSWLKKRPSLPPLSLGRSSGSHPRVAKAVRGLGDVEILKSYFLVVWSEWGTLHYGGFDEMCASLLEDFGGVGMGHHRVGLVQRLDRILAQLNLGLEHLRRDKPHLQEYEVQRMRAQYEKLKDVLLGVNARTSYQLIMLLRLLIQVGVRRISRNIYVCAPVAMSIAPPLEPSTPFIPPPSLHQKPDFNPRFHESHSPLPFPLRL